MEYAIGDRITAVQSANPTSIKLLGHGVYQGYKQHPEIDIENPCLKLDDGRIVWGMECWWGPESKVLPKMQKDFPEATIINV